MLKGMLPQYERKVSDLLKRLRWDRLRRWTRPARRNEMRCGADSKANPTATAAGEGARSTPAESPDDLAGVQQRVAAMPPIILGKDMADEIGATVGSVVLVTSPQGELTPFGMVPKYMRFQVAGIFNSGFFDYDSSWAFIRLADAQKLFGLGDVISVIQFKLDDIYRAGDVAAQLEQAAAGARLHGHQLDGAEPRPVPRPAPGARRHLHHHRPDRLRRRAQHPDLADHDGDGEDERHRRADVLGTKKRQIRRIFIAQGVLIGVIGTASAWCSATAPGPADTTTYLALARGLFHRLCAVRAAADRRPDRGPGFHRDFVHRHDLSVVVGRAILPAEALRYE